MLKRNLYKCEQCGRMTTIRSHGLCPICRKRQLDKGGRKKPAGVRKKNLSSFFNTMLETLSESRMSWTGRPIAVPTVCNVCHILPKRWYKSVAEEPDNIIFLTKEEHDLFDSFLDRLDFDSLEKVFGMVWKRVVSVVLNMEKEGKIKERGRLINGILERYEQ